ncbi:MAG TPA: hypothetical protein VHO66_06430 [Ruminiclostridium sp.]|nr:hypothetical protein [Ruminiclostridium sp.]
MFSKKVEHLNIEILFFKILQLVEGDYVMTDCIVDFPFIKGVSFGDSAKKGDFASRNTFASLNSILDNLDFNTVVLPINIWQKNFSSLDLVNSCSSTPDDWEIENLVDYIHKKGFRVVLKPTIKVETPQSGSIQAENFPSNWFESYTKFILHVAEIATEVGCSILSVGSALPNLTKYDLLWRRLIHEVRNSYSGFLTYISENDEENINWWDSLDIINTKPSGDFLSAIKNIDTTKKYDKPYIISGSSDLKPDNFKSVQSENISRFRGFVLG